MIAARRIWGYYGGACSVLRTEEPVDGVCKGQNYIFGAITTRRCERTSYVEKCASPYLVSAMTYIRFRQRFSGAPIYEVQDHHSQRMTSQKLRYRD